MRKNLLNYRTMSNEVDIKKLADLARIDVSSDELKDLQKELPEILHFVEQVGEAGGSVEKKTGTHYNIMRDDADPHASDKYSDDLISAMPESENRYLKVKKVISND